MNEAHRQLQGGNRTFEIADAKRFKDQILFKVKIVVEADQAHVHASALWVGHILDKGVNQEMELASQRQECPILGCEVPEEGLTTPNISDISDGGNVQIGVEIYAELRLTRVILFITLPLAKLRKNLGCTNQITITTSLDFTDTHIVPDVTLNTAKIVPVVAVSSFVLQEKARHRLGQWK